MIALNAVQAAVYARLTSQLSVPVYDFVPQNAPLPYAVIGADTSLPWDTKTLDGHEFTLTVHAFHQGAGRKGVKAVMEDIYAALHEQDVAVTGQAVVLARCEFTETSQEGDSDHYYHGVMRFRALTQNQGG